MITVRIKRHPKITIKLAATHRGAADFVEVSAAHVEPFRLLQVNPCPPALNNLMFRSPVT